MKRLDETVDEVVERRVDGVEAQRFPEELPRSSDPEALHDFVEAEGEVVQPVNPDDRGSEQDPGQGQPQPACHAGRIARGGENCRVLAAASQVVRFSLALWVGGTLLVALAAPVVFWNFASPHLPRGGFGG